MRVFRKHIRKGRNVPRATGFRDVGLPPFIRDEKEQLVIIIDSLDLDGKPLPRATSQLPGKVVARPLGLLLILPSRFLSTN